MRQYFCRCSSRLLLRQFNTELKLKVTILLFLVNPCILERWVSWFLTWNIIFFRVIFPLDQSCYQYGKKENYKEHQGARLKTLLWMAICHWITFLEITKSGLRRRAEMWKILLTTKKWGKGISQERNWATYCIVYLKVSLLLQFIPNSPLWTSNTETQCNIFSCWSLKSDRE